MSIKAKEKRSKKIKAAIIEVLWGIYFIGFFSLILLAIFIDRPDDAIKSWMYIGIGLALVSLMIDARGCVDYIRDIIYELTEPIDWEDEEEQGLDAYEEIIRDNMDDDAEVIYRDDWED